MVVRGISLFLGQVTGPEMPPFSQLLLTQFYFAGEAALIVGRNMLGPGRGGEETAVMVRPGGLRMDRRDRALIVDRKRPGVPIDYAALPREGHEVAEVNFGPEDLDRLWDVVMTFSFLVEQDRLWDPEFLANAEPEAPESARTDAVPE